MCSFQDSWAMLHPLLLSLTSFGPNRRGVWFVYLFSRLPKSFGWSLYVGAGSVSARASYFRHKDQRWPKSGLPFKINSACFLYIPPGSFKIWGISRELTMHEVWVVIFHDPCDSVNTKELVSPPLSTVHLDFFQTADFPKRSADHNFWLSQRCSYW